MIIPNIRIDSLSGKLLLIYLPRTMVIVLVLFLVLELDFQRSEQGRLVENLHRLVTVQEAAIAAAVWEFDLQRVRDLLAEQSRLPFFQGAEVLGKGGEVLAAAGDPRMAPGSPEFRVDRPLQRKSGTGIQEIGRLVVTVHDGGIRTALLQHFKVNGTILLVLVVTLVVGTWHGVRVVIGRPLEAFRRTIECPLDEQIRHPLRWDRRDELGELLGAYNDMMTARHRAETLMREREDELREAAREAQVASAEAARFNRLATDREVRMLELKELVNRLSAELGRSPPFGVVEMAAAGEVFGESEGAAASVATGSEYAIETLLEMSELQSLFENFCTAVGVPAAIIDLQGKVLASSHWQRACTGFHRVNAATSARCIESDTELALGLLEGKDFALYRCKNGMIDAASPIVVNQRHLANVFIGQFLLASPDWEFFRAQAQAIGFDPEGYLAAIAEVPVMDERKLPAILGFLARFAKLVATLSAERMDAAQAKQAMQRGQMAALNLAEDADQARAELADYQRELERLVEERTRDLRAAEERSRLILDGVEEGIFGTDKAGCVNFINPAALRMLGRDPEEMVGQPIHPLCHHHYPDGRPYPVEACPMGRALTHGESTQVGDEYLWRKDGEGFPAEYSAVPIWHGGGVVGSVVTFRDITFRRQAEAQVHEKMEELERFSRVAVGRELRMIALKEEVNRLAAELGRVAPYQIVE